MVGWWGWEKNLAGLPQEFDFCGASQTTKSDSADCTDFTDVDCGLYFVVS